MFKLAIFSAAATASAVLGSLIVGAVLLAAGVALWVAEMRGGEDEDEE